MAESNGPVVVGVDGSESSRTALSWAADEARLRDAEVRAVVVNDDPSLDDMIWAMIERIGQHARDACPGVEIYEKIARGHPAAELVRRSDDAQLIVVGSRGRTAFVGTVLGSVSTAVATHARCPAVVVREIRAQGPIVAGLDGSEYSKAVLRFAFDEARRHQTDLMAVQVWDVARAEYAPVVPPTDEEIETARDEARRSLAEQLDGWQEHYPDVTVRTVLERGYATAQLTEHSVDARLLVVGHRGRGTFADLMLGSVARGVLHHAHCPVTVVH
jgi:nucleotide-binding universal stress UspA family protein